MRRRRRRKSTKGLGRRVRRDLRRLVLVLVIVVLAMLAWREWRTCGRWKVTGYCPCVICCGKDDGITADGTHAPSYPGLLVAAPNDIPFGTEVYIEGLGMAIVHDRGGAIRGKHLDLFFQTHDEALQWGVKWRRVSVGKPLEE